LTDSVINAYEGFFRIMPDCCIEITDGREIGSKDRAEFTEEESKAVYGRNGFESRHCPIYSVNDRKKIQGARMQHMSKLLFMSARAVNADVNLQ